MLLYIVERDEFQDAMRTVDPNMLPEDIDLLFDSVDVGKSTTVKSHCCLQMFIMLYL